MRISRRLMKLIVGKDDNPVIVLASGKSIPNPSLDQCSPMIPDFSLFKVPKIDWKGRCFKISFEFWIWNYKCANNCSTFGSKFKNSLLWWPTHQLRNWSFYPIRTGSTLKCHFWGSTFDCEDSGGIDFGLNHIRVIHFQMFISVQVNNFIHEFEICTKV